MFSVDSRGSSGHDRVVDFTAGEDVIEIDSARLNSFDDILDVAEESWGNATITFGNGNTPVLEGVTVTGLSDFEFV